MRNLSLKPDPKYPKKKFTSQNKTKPVDNSKPENRDVQKNNVKLSLNWMDLDTYRKDGMNFLYQGKYSEAIQEFNKILTIFPTDAEAFKWKCYAQERITGKKSTRSLKIRESSDIISGAVENKPLVNILKTNSSKIIDVGDPLQQKLFEILHTFEFSIIEESKKISALLSDYCKGEYKKERNALIRAIKERIPQDLMKNPTMDIDTILLENYQQRLKDNWGMIPELSKYAVDSWVFALGKKKD